jgi:hypothetical protein
LYYLPFREARPLVSESQVFLGRWWSSFSISLVTAPECLQSTHLDTPASGRWRAIYLRSCESSRARLQFGCSKSPRNAFRPVYHLSRFTCKSKEKESGPEGTRTPDLRYARAPRWFSKGFQSLQTAGNHSISALILFPTSLKIYLGCCTVAAHIVLSISRPVGKKDRRCLPPLLRTRTRLWLTTLASRYS